MANIDELLEQLPIDRIAAALGVDEAQAAEASKAALPALVEGMQANAQQEQAANSLAKAIAEHAKAASSGTEARPDAIDDVDVDDGAKIVNHVFGDNTDAVVDKLGGIGGLGSGLFKKLLPLLAPIVMGYLGKKLVGDKQRDSGAADSDSDGGGGLGDILGDLAGDLLGGGSSGGGGLGDLLGGVLGGSGSSGGLGDLLGGLLGGGRR